MMQQYRSNSYLFGGNAPYVEELYEAYLDNPGSVPDNWRKYFDALPTAPEAQTALDLIQQIRLAAEKRGGAPIVESRWLQRLRALNMFIDDLYNDQRVIADGVFRSLARLLVTFAKFPGLRREDADRWVRCEGSEHLEAAQHGRLRVEPAER